MRPPHRLIVVRRDRPEVLDALRQAADDWPAGAIIMWDRRDGERRVRIRSVMLERRQRQRRVEPESTWSTHGFVVVETPRIPAEAIPLRPPTSYPGVHVDRMATEAGPLPPAGADEAGADAARARAVTQLARELIDRRRQWLCPTCSRPLRGGSEVLVRDGRLVHATCWSDAPRQ